MRRLACVLIMVLVTLAAISAESIKKARWEGDSHVLLMQDEETGLRLIITNITISGVHYEKAYISFSEDIDAVKCYNNIGLLSDNILPVGEDFDDNYNLISHWYVFPMTF